MNPVSTPPTSTHSLQPCSAKSSAQNEQEHTDITSTRKDEAGFKAGTGKEVLLMHRQCDAHQAQAIVNQAIAHQAIERTPLKKTQAFKKEVEEGYKKHLERTNIHDGFIVQKGFKLYEKWGCGDLYSIINVLGALHSRDEKVDFDQLTPESIWLHRGVKASHLDLVTRTTGNVPHPLAVILDNKSNSIVRTEEHNYKLSDDNIVLGYSNSSTPLKPRSRHTGRTCLPHGGINVLASTEPMIDNTYTQFDTRRIDIRIKLSDVFAQNGTLYKDIMASVNGALMVGLPIGETVPFEISNPYLDEHLTRFVRDNIRQYQPVQG